MYNKRSGDFAVMWLGDLRDEGVWNTEIAKANPFEADPVAICSTGINTHVRMYVSSVAFRGHVLVMDGFDNQVVVLMFGANG